MYKLLAPRGYLHDFVKGKIVYTSNIDDAALFDNDAALSLQSKIEGCAVMSESGQLMMLEDMVDSWQDVSLAWSDNYSAGYND